MNKKVSLGATIALIVITVALTVSVTMVIAMRHFNAAVRDLSNRQAQYEYLDDVDRAVRQNYYGTIDEEKLRQAMASGYIKGLGDPYAEYLTTDEYKKAQEILAGKTNGYGIEVAQSYAGEVVITTVYKNSPADKAGVTKGDHIKMIDGKDIEEIGYKGVLDKLKKPSKAIFTLNQKGTTKAYELSSGIVNIDTVEGRMIDTVAYIRLKAFNDTTAEQFRKTYEFLMEQNPTGFIFDIRNNSGGSLKAAQDVVSLLMPGGMYASLKDGQGKVIQMTAEATTQLEKKSVTLINSNTAGEAELFAGVLQEFGKTTLVGTHTFGRGVTQEYFQNSLDGSAVKLSTASFVLIKGGEWDGIGLEPDLASLLPTDAENNFELLDSKNDTQLAAAIGFLQPNSHSTVTTTTTQTTTVMTTLNTTAATTKK